MEAHAKIITLVNGKHCFSIPTQDGYDKVNLEDIEYVKGESNQSAFYLRDKRKIIADNSLMYWGEPLLEFGFARTHHSYIINLVYFTHYQKGRGGYVVLTNTEHSIPVSEKYKESFLDTFKASSDGGKPGADTTASSRYVNACPPYKVTRFENSPRKG